MPGGTMPCTVNERVKSCVPGEPDVDHEVAVGVDVDREHGQRDRVGADRELAHHVGQLDLGLVDADGVADLLVHDLEVEALEDLGRRAVEHDAKGVEVGVVEDDRELKEVARLTVAASAVATLGRGSLRGRPGA